MFDGLLEGSVRGKAGGMRRFLMALVLVGLIGGPAAEAQEAPAGPAVNPEYRIGGTVLLDFRHPEVRAHKLAVLREAVEFGADGISMDFAV